MVSLLSSYSNDKDKVVRHYSLTPDVSFVTHLVIHETNVFDFSFANCHLTFSSEAFPFLWKVAPTIDPLLSFSELYTHKKRGHEPTYYNFFIVVFTCSQIPRGLNILLDI
jgi:hypothetical protein